MLRLSSAGPLGQEGVLGSKITINITIKENDDPYGVVGFKSPNVVETSGKFEGTLLRRFLRFGRKCAEILNEMRFRVHTTPKIQEILLRRKSNDFLKGRTNHSFWRFFQETKEIVENTSLIFSSYNSFPS